MAEETRVLSSIEIRNLMLDTLAYEADDIDSEGKTFKKYGYQGTQSDLYRLMEGLAIKRGLRSWSMRFFVNYLASLCVGRKWSYAACA